MPDVTSPVGKAIEGEILVAARVIDFLSSGLYQSAAACLKELVNNSYDADASEVLISIKPDADVISIEDDGVGMSADDFVRHFGHVAESHKRDSGERTKKGRLKIGKIGIGFIAANELCDEMELYSTCDGSGEMLHVTIEFGAIRERSFLDRRRGNMEVHKADYHGEVLEADPSSHYTRIYLKKIRPHARDQFVRPTSRDATEDSAPSIYGLKSETVRDRLANLSDWDKLDLYSQTRMRVALNVPVGYLPHWLPPQHEDKVEQFDREIRQLGFRVLYDGTELLKPTVLTDTRGDSILERVQYQGEHVSVSGYMFARHGAFKPPELNGVLLRVRQAAVGEYDRNFLGYPKHIFPLFQDWVSAELYIEGQLDEALNIDRRTFSETHPAFVELQAWYIERFGQFLSRVRGDLYTKQSKARAEEKSAVAEDAIAQIKKKAKREIGTAAAAALEEHFPSDDGAAHDRERRRRTRRLTRSYSLTEILDIAVEVAGETLPAGLAEDFIRELGRRLNE